MRLDQLGNQRINAWRVAHIENTPLAAGEARQGLADSARSIGGGGSANNQQTTACQFECNRRTNASGGSGDQGQLTSEFSVAHANAALTSAKVPGSHMA